MRFNKFVILLVSLSLVEGCAVNTYNLATQREEYIFMSSEKEEDIGRKLSKQVEKKFKLEPDPLLQERVKEIGRKIAGVCDRKSISYHFAVLADDDEDKINAFALPGGYVFIFKAMLDEMESDDEIASVLSHEIAHIAARHSVKRMQASLGDTILRLILSRVETDSATRAKTHEALNQLMLSYSREDEILADRVGMKYMKLAGYRPEGMLTFLNRLMDIKRKAPIRRYHRYRTHPYLSERISLVREMVHGKMEFKDYINRGDETLPVK